MNGRFFSSLGEIVLRLRIPLLLGILVLVLVSVPGLLRLEVTVRIQDYFLKDDPILEAEQEFRRLFPQRDFIGVLVESQDVFSREMLGLIRKVSLELERALDLDGAAVSIAAMDDALSGGRALHFDEATLLSSPEEIEDIRRAFDSNPSLQGALFSADHRQAWVILPFESDAAEGLSPEFVETGRVAWETVGALDSAGGSLTATGVAVYAYRKKVEMMEDLARVLSIGAIVAVVFSLLILRSPSGVIGTLSVFVSSVTIVLGTQGWIGLTVDSAFLGLPILLAMGVSIGYTIHVHRFFVIGFEQTRNTEAAVIHAVSETARPIFFTAFTTIAALISFLFVEIQPIRWVGLASAGSIFVAFLLSLSLFPIVLSFHRTRGEGRTDRRPSGNDKIGRTLQRLAALVPAHRRAIILIFILLSVAGGYGLTRLKVDFDAERMMGTRLPHMIDQVRIRQSEIAQTESMSLVLRVPTGDFRETGLLRSLHELERRLSKDELVKRTASLTDVIRQLNFIVHRRDPASYRVPNGKAALRALLRLVAKIQPEERERWVTDDYTTAHVLIELATFSSQGIEDLGAEIGESVSALFPGDAEFFLTGSSYQMAMMNQYVTRGLIRSTLTALATITILMIIVFRSLKLGLIAMIPNVFPVLMAGGVMGLTGIRLEFVTMTVAPIILGLAVDDTIHLMIYLRGEIDRTGDFSGSLSRTFFRVGTAITETMIILCSSFLVFAVSRVNSIIYMGVIASTGMMFAYLADLFVTPVLMRRETLSPT